MKQIFFLTAVFIALSGYAQNNSGCVSGNCENGIGTYIWGADSNSPGDSYKGGWKNGLFHGNGTYTYANGESYTGAYVEGKRMGLGTQKYKDGSSYNGGWKNGIRNGYGTMVYSDGSRYEGNWLNDAQNGQGTYYFSKGDKFFGAWLNGLRDGNGVYTYKDGVKKEGVWRNDEFVTEPKKDEAASQIIPSEGTLKQNESNSLQFSVRKAPVYMIFTYDKTLQLFIKITSAKGELLYSADLSTGNSVKVSSLGNYQVNLIAKQGYGKWQVVFQNENEFKK